jgi:hypothetical protein
MTEEEWQASDEPGEMLDGLRGGATERKLRLFAVACCRQIWRYVAHPDSQDAIEVSEHFADGEATPAQLRVAGRKAADVASMLTFEASVSMRMSKYAARDAALAAAIVARKRLASREVASHARRAIMATPDRPKDQASLLRDIFGNPFRPAAIDPAWLTSTVVALARGIYDDRAFDRMPILGDALEDAGCDNADILVHCRDANATHVRGCWVVDLVLGKE